MNGQVLRNDVTKRYVPFRWGSTGTGTPSQGFVGVNMQIFSTR